MDVFLDHKEVVLPISYKRQRLATTYRADFICYENVVLELRAQKRLGGVEEAQIINYLKATSIRLGLLVNFGTESLEYRRFVYSGNMDPPLSQSA